MDEKTPSILSIEDHLDTTAGVADDLRELGFRVRECRTVQEAATLVQATRFDLMLVDLVIPWQDVEEGGRIFLRQVKSGGLGDVNVATPFVVLTAYPDKDTESIRRLPGYLGAIAKTSPVIPDLAALARGKLNWFPENVSNVVPDYIVEDVLIFEDPPDTGDRVWPNIPSWPYGSRVPVALADLPEDLQAEIGFREFPVLVWAKVNVDAERPEDVLPHDYRVIWHRDAAELVFD